MDITYIFFKDVYFNRCKLGQWERRWDIQLSPITLFISWPFLICVYQNLTLNLNCQMFDFVFTVQTLRTIFAKLQHRPVNIERTSCSDRNSNFTSGEGNRTIICDCTVNSTCHVTRMLVNKRTLSLLQCFYSLTCETRN